jgi:hypothetical protein
LRPDDEEFILRSTREIVDRFGEPASVEAEPDIGRVSVFGVPTADGADEIALVMLRTLIRKDGTGELVTAGSPTGYERGLSRDADPAAILIAAVGPGRLTEVRYLCRRLRRQFPSVKIVVGRWGRGKDLDKARPRFFSAGADGVVATLRDARADLARQANDLVAALERAEHE